MIKTVMKLAAVGAAFLGAATIEAQAANPFPATIQNGETAGLATGAPLPEGVYFVNTLSFGVRNTNPDGRFLVDVPVIAWATPWTVLGGQIQVIGALPMAHLSANNSGVDEYGLYNPFAAGAIAWDLGGGFGFRYLSGFYFNAGNNLLSVPATTWRQDFAVSYTGDGWNLTSNLSWGISFDTDRSAGGKTSNGFALDLTATKTFGKWEFGAVGFGSYEYDLPTGQRRSKQFAVGPLVGYNFGPVILQAYLTRDVYARNQEPQFGAKQNAKETRFWTRVIIPLWTPTAPVAPLVTKY